MSTGRRIRSGGGRLLVGEAGAYRAMSRGLPCVDAECVRGLVQMRSAASVVLLAVSAKAVGVELEQSLFGVVP